MHMVICIFLDSCKDDQGDYGQEIRGLLARCSW